MAPEIAVLRTPPPRPPNPCTPGMTSRAHSPIALHLTIYPQKGFYIRIQSDAFPDAAAIHPTFRARRQQWTTKIHPRDPPPSPFKLTLYNTIAGRTYLFFLIGPVMAGNLWTDKPTHPTGPHRHLSSDGHAAQGNELSQQLVQREHLPPSELARGRHEVRTSRSPYAPEGTQTPSQGAAIVHSPSFFIFISYLGSRDAKGESEFPPFRVLRE